MQKYSKENRDSYIQEWKTSGKSIVAFCTENVINKNTFQYWLKREKETKRKGFVEINVKKQYQTFEHSISIEAGKIKINFPSGHRKDELEAVIKMLWALTC